MVTKTYETRRKPNHTFHVIMTIITCGLWLPVWILMNLFSWDRNMTAGWRANRDEKRTRRDRERELALQEELVALEKRRLELIERGIKA